MISPRHIAQLVDVPPLPDEFFKIIHDLSVFLIVDDRHDIGRSVYYNRSDHYYHGHHSPHHPSPYHHWQLGLAGLIFSQLGSMFNQGMQLYNDYQQMEAGNIEGMDPEILNLIKQDNNVVTLEQYKEEVKTIPARQVDPPESLPGFSTGFDLPHFPS